ncbi:MAG: helix-turn-helix domain-containing protein [Clostridia bacterium]|nr:helix-turn-helix domain-containing protein [Clostridia bacterium]
MNNVMTYKDKDLDLSIEYKSAKTNKTVNHFHKTYELYYLMGGSRIFIIDNKTLNILPGSIVLVSPYTSHQIMNASETTYKAFIVTFTLNTLSVNRHYKFKNPNSFLQNNYSLIPLSKNDQNIYKSYVEKILAEMHDKHAEYDLAIYGIFLQMLSFCQRNYDAQSEDLLSSPLVPARSDPVIRYINEHYREKLSLTRLSEIFYVSPSYLSRSFKKDIGISLVEYINSVRIQKAITMLVSSNCSVVQVAKRCGFTSTQNFNRVFKQITGSPPSFYKKNDIFSQIQMDSPSGSSAITRE